MATSTIKNQYLKSKTIYSAFTVGANTITTVTIPFTDGISILGSTWFEHPNLITGCYIQGANRTSNEIQVFIVNTTNDSKSDVVYVSYLCR